MSGEYPRIYVAGHRGMVGSAIVRKLIALGQPKECIITRTRADLDLKNQASVRRFFEEEEIDQVYLAAARVGGIHANNTYPSAFIYENLMIEANVIEAAFSNGVRKLLFLGSSCIYPSKSPQPMAEHALLTGSLEPTNEPYAIAKIAGIKLCESYNREFSVTHGIDYRSVMPTNLYGPGDNYHPDNAHVIPALLRRFHEAMVSEAKHVVVWGTGRPRREFLYVDDMAEACLFVMDLEQSIYRRHTEPMCSHINVGVGHDISIKELAETIASVVGYNGKVVFDATKPDGTMRKLLDSTRINVLGWRAKVPLVEGLNLAYMDFTSRRH